MEATLVTNGPEAKPDQPTWYGFSEATSQFIELVTEGANDERWERLQSLQRRIADHEAQVEHCTQRISELRERLAEEGHSEQYLAHINDALTQFRQEHRDSLRQRAACQAELRALEADSEAEVSQADAFAQLNAIRHLPGVQRVRLDDGDVVISIRTRTVHKGRLYFLGDYDLRLMLRQESFRGPKRLTIRIHCTKTGKNRLWGAFVCHPYWTTTGASYAHSDLSFRETVLSILGLGRGKFCFGVRADAITTMLKKGQVAQAIQVMIDSMNRLNTNDLKRLIFFKRMWLTRRRRRELLILKAQGYNIDIDESE